MLKRNVMIAVVALAGMFAGQAFSEDHGSADHKAEAGKAKHGKEKAADHGKHGGGHDASASPSPAAEHK